MVSWVVDFKQNKCEKRQKPRSLAELMSGNLFSFHCNLSQVNYRETQEKNSNKQILSSLKRWSKKSKNDKKFQKQSKKKPKKTKQNRFIQQTAYNMIYRLVLLVKTLKDEPGLRLGFFDGTTSIICSCSLYVFISLDALSFFSPSTFRRGIFNLSFLDNSYPNIYL